MFLFPRKNQSVSRKKVIHQRVENSVVKGKNAFVEKAFNVQYSVI